MLLGIVWMGLLYKCAKPMVYATLMSNGVIMIALGIYLAGQVRGSTSCTLTSGDCTAAAQPYWLCLVGAIYLAWVFCARCRASTMAL